MLACLQSRDRHLCMQMIRRADIDQADFRILDSALPIAGCMFPAPSLFELVQFGLISPADRVHDRKNRHIKKLADFKKSIAMRPAHEFLADEANVDGWFLHV